MQLGRLGAWYSTDKLGGPQQIKAFVQTVERLGYDTLWYPESRGYESLSVAGFMLANTTKLNLGSSIASIYARDAFTSRRGLLSLQALYGDRFILGLGVSHVPMVEGCAATNTRSRCRRCAPISTASPRVRPAPRLADRHRGPRPADAEAVGGANARARCPTTPRRSTRREAARILGADKWLVAEQKVRIGNRSGEGARARAERAVALHGARQLPQQLAAHRLLRGGARRTAGPIASSTRWCCGAPPTRCARGCARISTPARRRSASSRCTRTATPRRAIRILTELADT